MQVGSVAPSQSVITDGASTRPSASANQDKFGPATKVSLSEEALSASSESAASKKAAKAAKTGAAAAYQAQS
ncbi:MAG: hypothetical protein AAGA48_08685 [Myxococcota bacterium]